MSRKRTTAEPNETTKEKRICLPSTSPQARLFATAPIKQPPMPPHQKVDWRFVIPNGSWLHVHDPYDTYLRYAQVVGFDRATGAHTLRDQLTTETFCRTLSDSNTINPMDPRYAHCTTMKNINWLRDNLHATLCEIQNIQCNKCSNQQEEKQKTLFHRRVYASLFFENINALPGHTMSTQPRCFNMALVCSLHEVVTKHSLYDMKFYLLSKNPQNHTIETTLKKFCFATIAFRIATGLNLKIDVHTRCIKDLLKIDHRKHNNATTFLNFFAAHFHPSYTAAFQDVRTKLEDYDLYKRKMNLLAKKRSPLYSGETPKGGAMHYNHFRLYDNLSNSFHTAFLSNDLSLQGCPNTHGDGSRNNKFPLLTAQQRQDITNRRSQLWNIFRTDW